MRPDHSATLGAQRRASVCLDRNASLGVLGPNSGQCDSNIGITPNLDLRVYAHNLPDATRKDVDRQDCDNSAPAAESTHEEAPERNPGATDAQNAIELVPKSSTFTRPSGVILMFAGLRSR